MPHRFAALGAVTAFGFLLLTAAGFAAPRIAQPGDTEIAARALVPLLRDVRESLQSQVTVQPGRLPNSPFTGRNSTLFAVTIGFNSTDIDQSVVDAMNRLVQWNESEPLNAADRELVERWLEALSVKVVGRMAAGGKGVSCNNPCVVQHLTNPDTLFGATRREQRETRDFVLLEAFKEAVADTRQ